MQSKFLITEPVPMNNAGNVPCVRQAKSVNGQEKEKTITFFKRFMASSPWGYRVIEKTGGDPEKVKITSTQCIHRSISSGKWEFVFQNKKTESSSLASDLGKLHGVLRIPGLWKMLYRRRQEIPCRRAMDIFMPCNTCADRELSLNSHCLSESYKCISLYRLHFCPLIQLA